jgi:hypothetical protein
MRAARGIGGITGRVLGTLLWTTVTLWLGAWAIWWLAHLVRRWRFVSKDKLVCPRGHEVVLLGSWRCGCGAAFDGYVFAKCPVCRRTAGWVPCGRCQLVVRNPALD